ENPTMPPAPGLVSSTIGWPTTCETLSRTTRAVVSDALPAGKGLMTLIGRVGQSSAWAKAAASRSAAPRAVANGRSNDTKTSRALNRPLWNPAGVRAGLPCRTTCTSSRGQKKVIAAFALAETGRPISRRCPDRAQASGPAARYHLDVANRHSVRRHIPSSATRRQSAKGNDAQALLCRHALLCPLPPPCYFVTAEFRLALYRARVACFAMPSHFPGAEYGNCGT